MNKNINPPHFESEVSIGDIASGLWRQKLLVFAVASLLICGSAIYAFTTTPTYEARLVILPPTESDIAQLNIGRDRASELDPLGAKEVYDFYLQNLQSEYLRRQFFREFYLPSLGGEFGKESQDELYSKFSKILQFGALGAESPGKYYMMVSSSSPETAANWLAKYSELASDRTKSQLIRDLKAGVLVKAKNLEQSILASRNSAKKQRDDQIALLTEALSVANSIGLEKPPIISNSLSGEVSAGMEGELTYMRGSKAIKTEIENLKNRSSDDPFIRDLRKKEELVSFYKSFSVDSSNFEVYRQDGAIQLPDRPVKPNKPLIIFLGALFGILIGGFLGLMREFFGKKYKVKYG
ncbi:LPS O-antigen chain length determinant protein WzzB [Pseudomonas oryzihabitans]|uniref:LPS O-antigen chain length determinant protein WzzB n=1 Tax=Pseudomonas oryzihabitans TaxID=47885 RepID=UPI0028946052|nr:Wzz/FepE/Etk N-terminal domain-containing protein [Pseudomonas oryzihabitans]MDT3719482.1 Wzz/FepE/Etk N-terminal domain-containing protein [Pseudomonas oryzihabitans]